MPDDRRRRAGRGGVTAVVVLGGDRPQEDVVGVERDRVGGVARRQEGLRGTGRRRLPEHGRRTPSVVVVVVADTRPHLALVPPPLSK